VRSRDDECVDCNLGYVANIDESDATGARWHEEAAILNDVVSVGIAQVLSEETRSDDGPSLWTAQQVLLDRVVRHEWVVRGTCDGDKYDLPHTLVSCDVKKRVEGRPGVGDGGWTKQENGITAARGAPEGARFEKIEVDRLAVTHRTNRAWLPYADAKAGVTVAKATDDR